MKLSKRHAALIATGIAGAMALTACGGGSGNNDSGSGSSSGGRVIYGEATDWPENLFQGISAGNATSTQNIMGRVLPSPFIVKPDFSVVYDKNLLASEPKLDTSGGGQVITYEINKDAVWSDGTPISADDFIYTWKAQRSADPADGGCEGVLSTNGYANISDVKGSDDGKTVTVTFKPSYADWQAVFGPIYPAHIMANDDPATQCQTFTTGWPIADGVPSDISGGPWQVLKKNIDVGGQVIVLTPNPKWWGDKAKLDQLVIQGIGNDPTTAVQGLQNQELGVIYPQPQLDLVDQVEALKPNVTSKITFGLSFEHLDFNTSDPNLADPNVRKAFAMALDRQEIVDQTVGQVAPDAQVLDNHLYVNNQPQYADNAPEQYQAQDVAGAKALLEKSGYELGADGVYAKGRQRLSFRIDTTPGNALRETTITVMAQQLAQAGIEVTYNPNPDLFSGPDTPTSVVAGGFQIALFASTGSPFATSLIPSYQSPARGFGQNVSRAGTAAIDALLDKVATDQDAAQQAADANAADELLWEQMATLPLFQKPTLVAYDSALRGVQNNASQSGVLWNSDDWSLRK